MNLEKLREKPQFLCLHCGNDKQGLLRLVLGKDLGNIPLVLLKKNELNLYKMHLFEGFALELVKLQHWRFLPGLSFVNWDLEDVVTTFQALLGMSGL